MIPSLHFAGILPRQAYADVRPLSLRFTDHRPLADSFGQGPKIKRGTIGACEAVIEVLVLVFVRRSWYDLIH